MNPVQKPIGVLRLVANSFKTGFFDIVELRIANSPMMESVQKMRFPAYFTCKVIDKPAMRFI